MTVASGDTLSFGYYGYGSASNTLTSTSSVSGAGSVSFVSGTTTVAGTLQASGVFTIQAGSVTVSGAATLTGNLTNNGTLNIGNGSTTGTIANTGNYTQGTSATLGIGIGGLTPGTQFDQLTVSGTATLAGTLNLSLINGYMPSAGNSFQIITCGTRCGTFGTVTGTTQGSRTLTPAYNSGNVTIQVTMAPVQPEEDEPGEEAERTALALLLRGTPERSAGMFGPPALAEYAVFAEEQEDVFVVLGTPGERVVRGPGWADRGAEGQGLDPALLDGRREIQEDGAALGVPVFASLLGMMLTPVSGRLGQGKDAEKKRCFLGLGR